MIKPRPFETHVALLEAVETLLRETLPRPGAIMLSGGSTPYAVYHQLTARPCRVDPARQLFLSDERRVPIDSPRSNTGNLEPMLAALACRDRFIPIDTTLPADKAAEQFARALSTVKQIDLGLLGLGLDGHTAGLFTLEQARQQSGPLTLHTDRPDGLEGISVTPAIFNQTDRIILLVTGEEKRAIVETLLRAPATLPTGVALADHPCVELWTDLSLKR